MWVQTLGLLQPEGRKKMELRERKNGTKGGRKNETKGIKEKIGHNMQYSNDTPILGRKNQTDYHLF